MSAVIKLFLFIVAAGVMPAMTGLLPVSFLPKEKRRVPWILMSGYLLSFALFEVLGIPVLLFTTYGDYALLCVLFTAADLAVIALGVFRCVRTGGIRLPYGLEVQAELHHRKLRDLEDGKRVAESGTSLRSGGAGGRNAGRNRDTKRQKMIQEAYDPDTMFFWIIFMLLLLFELFMAYTNASIDGDDSYYVAQSVQTWQTGTMYYYVPYTGWTTTLDGRHALSMMPIWVSYLATFSGTHPTIVAHTMLPMVLIPLADLCLYCAACELVAGFPEYRQRRMLPAIMILIAMMQIFGNISIYTPETFLILRTWQGKSLFANLILPAAFVLLLYWCGNHTAQLQRPVRGRRQGTRRAKPAASAVSGNPDVSEASGNPAASDPGGLSDSGPERDRTGRNSQGSDAERVRTGRNSSESGPERVRTGQSSPDGKKNTDPVRTARIPDRKERQQEAVFFWGVIVCLNLASGFTTALAPAILTVLLVGAAFLIAVFMRKGRFLLAMFAACIPNYLYLILLLRTINSQWFSFLKGGRLP